MQEIIVKNLPTIVFVLLLLSSFLAGYHMGFLRKVISFISFILAIMLAKFFTPLVSEIVNNATGLNKAISDAAYNAINNTDIMNKIRDIPNLSQIAEAGKLPDLSSIPELANIPYLKEVPFLNSEFDFSNIEGSIREISANVGNSIVNVICGIVLFIILFIILKILARILSGALNKVPIVGFFNKTLGGILGVFEMIIISWIVFSILRVLEGASPEITEFTTYVSSSPIINYFYNNNVIYNFFANLFSSGAASSV